MEVSTPIADIQGLQVTALANASTTVPRWQISGLLTDPKTGAVVADFVTTPVNFPDVLLSLTVAQRRALLDLIITWLLHTRAGITL